MSRTAWSSFGGVAAMCMIASLLSSLPADARTDFPAKGGSGDITNAAVCPVGHFIVGFRGRAGLWIDQIRIRCAPLLMGGGVGDSKAFGGAGGSGGGPLASKCPSGSIVNDLRWFNTQGNRQVELILFNCMNPDTQRAKGNARAFGNENGPRSHRFRNTCPEGEGAVGINQRWGQHVNAIGLICDILRRP